jgi:hypothetical protein
MYKSPIDVMIADIQHQIAQQQDEEIYKAVVSVGINVDKDELIRALQYDRDQYNKGYAAGKRDAIADLVRCKDCTNFERKFPGYGYCYHWDYEQGMSPNEVEDDDFCSYGERRTNA